ncbi:RuBisCO large subunit C-terminal-like domain-containing protein [Alkalilimnicola ehrlichii]|uniref:RuBisCO large subunit C-terminal-like domain-containing protein n=1 Tax=Alkalilimnicola ehrlichii TaxID=351052 RepID=UPI002162850D|nr:RuBisCO large subunit C-terminal-like domain-containing protein [Alkalilimnicola ehrlichii]
MTERLLVSYQLHLSEGESAEEKARGIALEQTVELPWDCVPEALREQVVGEIVALEAVSADCYTATIAYPLEVIGNELTQCLNVLFGNISLKGGLRIVDIRWPTVLTEQFAGPAFGVAGLRQLCQVQQRPLLATALKPVGLKASELAQHCYQFALGGIDIIKDDHGLADQPSAPFRERLQRCQEAVTRANAETGNASLYFPNVTAGPGVLEERLAAAAQAGCKGVLISPWLTGLDAMRAARDRYGLALMAHPAFTGSYFTGAASIAPGLFLGDLFRLAAPTPLFIPTRAAASVSIWQPVHLSIPASDNRWQVSPRASQRRAAAWTLSARRNGSSATESIPFC